MSITFKDWAKEIDENSRQKSKKNDFMSHPSKLKLGPIVTTFWFKASEIYSNVAKMYHYVCRICTLRRFRCFKPLTMYVRIMFLVTIARGGVFGFDVGEET